MSGGGAMGREHLYYILDDDNKPLPAGSIMEYCEWSAQHPEKRVTAKTVVREERHIEVSTVFLGIDHGHERRGPPILWETMVFGGIMDQYQVRYRSHEEALESHYVICALVETAETMGKYMELDECSEES